MSVRLEKIAEELKAAFFSLVSARDVAALLDVTYSQLTYHANRSDPARRYVAFSVAKRAGGSRQIFAPATPLKILQQKLNQVFQAVYVPRPSTQGFVAGRNVVTNAQKHSNKRWVLNLDLEDFFPSINFGRVRGLFMAWPYNRNSEIATVLAQICCHENQLPQGAPTSPTVSNMICAKLDKELQWLAQNHKCDYSRYADDLTFSTSLRTLSPELARLRAYPAQPEVEVGPALRKIIESNGFQVNRDKMRLRRYDRRQEVTGLKVNNFPNVKKRYLSQLRAMLHAWKKWGYEAAETEFLTRYDRKHRKPEAQPPSFGRVLAGKIAYLGMVRGKASLVYRELSGTYDSLRKRRPHDAVWVLECQRTGVQGTAFMLKGFGLVTCSHVLGPETKAFRADDYAKSYPVRIVKKDDKLDLAILAIDVETAHQLVPGDPARVKVGDHVTVLGFPNYNPGETIHEYTGKIAGKVRRFNTDRFSISAPIIKGSSGGPTLNRKGEVIGVSVTGEDSPKPNPSVEYGVIAVDTLQFLLPDAKTV